MEASERNVGSPGRRRAAARRPKGPTSGDPRRAEREDGDQEHEPRAAGISVRRGPQDGAAQPEAEEPGELQRGAVRLRGKYALPEEIPLGLQPPVPLQRLVPLLQQVQESIPQLQLHLQVSFFFFFYNIVVKDLMDVKHAEQ